MRSVLILAILALFFASCHNEVPGLPTPDEVEHFKFCYYKDKNGEEQCKSTYEIFETDCTRVGGKLCGPGCKKSSCEE